MDRDAAIRTLRAHETQLRAMGILHLSLFGSVARGESRHASDIDLAATLDYDRVAGAFKFLEIQDQLADLLGRPVDLVSEPVRKARLQARIDQDRVHVF